MQIGDKNYLVETALLTHGVNNISNDELKSFFTEDISFVYIDKGELMLTNIDEFLLFRNRKEELIRIDKDLYDKAKVKKLSGPLTASGTMKACEELGKKVAISAGIGGIGDIKGEELCPDLPALEEIPVALLCTSFKDMLDREESFQWLKERNIKVVGKESDISTGFMFSLSPIKLSGVFKSWEEKPSLLLNEIEAKDRFTNRGIIDEMIKKGKEAEKIGKMYHPTANAILNKRTNNKSSYLQIKSLVNNIKWAEDILK